MSRKTYCHFCAAPLTEKLHEGRSRLFCLQCNQPIYENPIPASAAIVFNTRGEVLLVKRNVEPQKGEWCLPGGFVELKERPEDCCLRELEEETGLQGSIDRLVGVCLSGSPIYTSVIIIGYIVNNIHGKLKAGDDSDEACFFKLHQRPPMAFRSHEKILQDALNVHKSIPKVPPQKSILESLGAYVITSGDHIRIAEGAGLGGAQILQYRDKKSSRKEMLVIAHKIREITRKYNILYVVNDYIDIALLSGADGVHLGQDDIAVSEARQMVPEGFIICKSTHSLDQAIAAQKEGADYIGIGPVYATPTKKHYNPIGPVTVAKVIKAVDLPVVAIGGLNLKNMAELRSMGVKNIAMVRAFQKNTSGIVNQINQLFHL